MSKQYLVDIKSLEFAYSDFNILEHISFRIFKRDFIAIIGPNGSGKTTLMKLLLGLLQPTKGSIKNRVDPSRIGYVPQHYSIDRNFPGTVREILGTDRNAKTVGVDMFLDKKFAHLSGGQQQRVLIALALLQDPKLLILDEPTTGIDIEAQVAFYNLLRKLNKAGLTIVLVTHEMSILPDLVDRVICINKTLTCSGHSKELPKLLKKVYGDQFMEHVHKGGKPRV